MSTEIYISNNNNACKPEFTKIAANSFVFNASGITDGKNQLFFGGTLNDGYPAIWSSDLYNYANKQFEPLIPNRYKTVGIPIPINLVANDIVTLSGTAVFADAQPYYDANYDLTLIVGVYHFDCSDTRDNIPAYTFIPLDTFALDSTGTVCFETNITLSSNFDIHTTRLIVGFDIVATCPNGVICSDPISINTSSSVSYTFDIERPCAVITSESNFIIRNCCEPLITELVHIPGSQVGNFHVDDQGNCWEVLSASNDVTNFTRNFVNVYDTCLECQIANPCPQNLNIISCCVHGEEFISGSLPGLIVGDTFVDNYGLCWTVANETSAPITEESITIDTIITGDCDTCTTANPCPDFWYITSCCTAITEVIATTTVLNPDDAFVDTNGICWRVDKEANELPTNYNIVVDTVYTGAVIPSTNCDLCIAANPCPTEYYITIRECCDPDRVEVAQVPANYMEFSEGTVFSDWWGICWEVMSYSTTGVETWAIWDWACVSFECPSPNFPNFKDCISCINFNGKCKTFYEVQNCNTGLVQIYKMEDNLTIGEFYINQLDKQCYQILGYGYPTFSQNPTAFRAETKWPVFTTCTECLIGTPALKQVVLQPCCGGPNITLNITGPWINGIGSVQVVWIAAIGQFQCYTLISASLPTGISGGFTNSAYAYADCPTCIAAHPCT